ncbi:MAG: NUDIX domain-containing protein [Thermomicrobiales bacterium]
MANQPSPLHPAPLLGDDELRERFPALFVPRRWGNIDLTGFHLLSTWPPIETVQSVNIVPFQADACLVIVDERGGFQLPGGTRERGESLEETGRRELLEEVGATFAHCHPFGWLDCHSHDERPWRPFLMHPDFTRAIAWADVERIGGPTNPDGAEQIAEVLPLSPDEAASRLRHGGRPELADIYLLAASVRTQMRQSGTNLA